MMITDFAQPIRIVDNQNMPKQELLATEPEDLL